MTIQSKQLMAWGDGGIADPRVAHKKYPNHFQTHLWKIAAALYPVRLYQGTYAGTPDSVVVYSFDSYEETNITACVPLPYLFFNRGF